MSAKLSVLPNLGGIQVPTDLAYVVDVSAGAGGSTRSTLNDLFAIITKNITDGAVRFQGFAAPSVSGAGQGALYYDSTDNRFKISENAGAYRNIGDVGGPGASTDNAIARFDLATGKLIQNSAVTVGDTGNTTGVGTLNTHTIPAVAADTFALLSAAQTFTNKTITASSNVLGGVTMTLGSDATGDVYFRSVGGQLTRLAIGSANQVLTVSAGLPAWQNPVGAPGGSSTQVQFNNSGTFGGITGATSDGTNITVSDGALRTTSPLISTGIDDSGGNPIIGLSPVGSAVNQITVANAATGNGPTLSATGSDTNIPINVSTKGAGNAVVNTNSIARVTVAGVDANTYFGNGITNAAPANYVINATGGSGTNIAGANLDLAGGRGTGNAAPGQVAVRYPLQTASGTGLQSLSTERFPVSTCLFSVITSGTAVSNTTTETSLFTGATFGAGSTRTIEAGSAAIGTVYKIFLSAQLLTTGTPTLTIKVKLGTTIIANTGAVTTPNNSNGILYMEVYVTVTGVGAGGGVRAEIPFGRMSPAIAGAITPVDFVGTVGGIAIDFTANQTIDVTAQWGTASPSNLVQLISDTTAERFR